jgi:hypothetical protein
MIVKVEGGWSVKSEKGKNLGGPYKSRKQAEKRLAEVERFKHMNKSDVDSKERVMEVISIDEEFEKGKRGRDKKRRKSRIRNSDFPTYLAAHRSKFHVDGYYTHRPLQKSK